MKTTVIRYDIIRHRYPKAFLRLSEYITGIAEDTDWYNLHEPTDTELRDFFNRNNLDYHEELASYFFNTLENRL